MKKFPLQLKLRHLRWLAHFMALTLAVEAAALPVLAGDLDERCLSLMAKAAPLDPAIAKANKDREKAKAKKEGDIRRAQTAKARPLHVDEELLAYYKTHPEEVGPWLEDIKIRKDSGLVTDTEDITALAVTSQKAQEVLATLLPRKNITVRYSSRLGSIIDLFHLSDLQKYQANVKPSSRIPLWVWRAVKGLDRKYVVIPTWSRAKAETYSRAFTITLQRQVPERPEGDTSLVRPPNVNYEEYSDSILNALYTAKMGSDPNHVIFDLKQKAAAIVAAGDALLTDGKVKLNYESNTNFIPLDKILRQVVLRMYKTALVIGNSQEGVAAAVVNPELVNGLVKDLNQKTTANFYGPEVFMNRLADRTAQREIPNSIFQTLKIATITFVVWLVGHELIVGFFPAGAGKVINGNTMTDDAACVPGKIEYEDVMLDKLNMTPISPFLPVFIKPNAIKGHEGENNPCDPQGDVALALKDTLDSPEVNHDENAFDKWKELNVDEMAKLRNMIRAQYQYTDVNKPSACALYYGMYTRCPDRLDLK